MMGAEVFYKCENLQRIGAFKFRGASNAVMSLSDEEAAKGVVTHSSGNFAQALALSARLRGIPAHVVMPEGSSLPKIEAVRDFGAETTFCAPNLAAREATASAVQARTGATFVHPYDDTFVIAGQGTAALELLEECPDLDAVAAPLGGGGLLAGTALAAEGLAPGARVIGVEPSAADDARQSLLEGHIVQARNLPTIADGLRTSLGTLTFAVLRRTVAEVVTASEAEIAAAMKLFLSRTKLLIEPSSAVVVAALLAKRLAGRRIGVILSGGNVDLDHLPWI